ncbi:hypothetical protein T03_14782 [Trichinella britovi]|uniref:Uncharacterized protein n=1 Tax=Trichinella britovi TaxID=45882 RepID=A0A0V1C2Z8_TRIBR|nr:hypothetical protein T06_3195 [Trichinella sp. T6]KRY43705.1 hypothetical protein T03_14782 [Trichinella britovi]
MTSWHGIFQSLDGVSFSSRQPLFTNEIRLMKPAMRRARSSEDLPLTLLNSVAVCPFAFRRKFVRVVSFRSRRT